MMYSSMVFLVYYCFCTAVYFKYGYGIDMGNVIVIVLGGILLGFTFVSFIRDPSCFDYFRF
jgi:branched-subunit amino acid transport protein AzlD